MAREKCHIKVLHLIVYKDLAVNRGLVREIEVSHESESLISISLE